MVFELLSNALDEDVTQIDITLTRPKNRVSHLKVEDDSPDGFQDLSHAWTLFAESKKKGGDCVFVWHPTPRDEACALPGPGYGERIQPAAKFLELGIPVVELPDDKYSVNVLQRVPLNTDRDNVTPAYLRDLRAHVLNHMARNLEKEETQATWVRDAMESPVVRAEAVDQVRVTQYGEKSAIFNPADQEANARAVAAGYTVIPGAAYSKRAWENIREAGNTTWGMCFIWRPTPRETTAGRRGRGYGKRIDHWGDGGRNHGCPRWTSPTPTESIPPSGNSCPVPRRQRTVLRSANAKASMAPRLSSSSSKATGSTNGVTMIIFPSSPHQFER